MFRAGQSFPSLTRPAADRARTPVCPLLRLRVAVAFLACLVLTSRSHAEDELRSIRSYSGNFMVTAADASTAAWAAKAGELTRERVFDLLGYTSQWTRAASIVLRTREDKTAAGEVQLWTIFVGKRGFKVVNMDVYPSKRDDVVVLQVVNLCLADMAGLAGGEKKPRQPLAIPPWLVCGVAESLSAANLAHLREYAAGILSSEEFLPIEQLFRAETIPADEVERELFFKESGSVVDFLLHQEEGRPRLKEAITRFQDQSDFTASLLFAFSRDFTTVAQLEDGWKRFAVQQAERTIGASKMLLSETKEALDRVLTVEIPTVERSSLEEKVITTDLTGLFRHRNRLIVRQIASEKASEVFRLSLRAKPEYRAVLQEYLQALTAIAKDDGPGFKRHFALAERLRRKLEQTITLNVEKPEDANTSDE